MAAYRVFNNMEGASAVPPNRVSIIYRRLIKRYQEIGFWRTILYYGTVFWNLCLSITPSRLRLSREQREKDEQFMSNRLRYLAEISRQFDAELNLDTGGWIDLRDPYGAGLNWEQANRMRAYPELFRSDNRCRNCSIRFCSC